MSRPQIVDALQRNRAMTYTTLFWGPVNEDRFVAMVAAGDYNRSHPQSQITPDEVV